MDCCALRNGYRCEQGPAHAAVAIDCRRLLFVVSFRSVFVVAFNKKTKKLSHARATFAVALKTELLNCCFGPQINSASSRSRSRARPLSCSRALSLSLSLAHRLIAHAYAVRARLGRFACVRVCVCADVAARAL